MKRQKIGYNALVCSTLACSLCLGALNAQEGPRAEKTLKLGPYEGRANFGYTLAQGDTVLNGEFTMQRSNLMELLERQDYSFLFKGQFENGVPQGEWTFEFGKFQSDQASKVVDYQYRVLVSGTQESAKGSISNGVPDGTWVILEEEIEKSEIARTLFKSEISFAKGVPERSFQLTGKSHTLMGRFLRNGLAHDEWALFPNDGLEQTESWHFNEGLLQYIQMAGENTSKRLPIFQTELAPQFTTINLDERYLALVHFYGGLSDGFAVAIAKLPLLLEQNWEHYQNIQDILGRLGEASFRPEFKVKVPFFQMTTKDSNAVKEIRSHYLLGKEAANRILANTQLKLLKLSNPEALYLYNLTQKLQENYVEPLTKLMYYESLGVVPYLSPNLLIKGLWPNGIPMTLNVSNVSKALVPWQLEWSGADENSLANDFYKIAHLSQQTNDSFREIEQKLAAMLSKDERQTALITQEDSLIKQQALLRETLDTLRVQLPERYLVPVDGIQSMAAQLLGAYSENGEEKNKLERAQQVSKCLNDLQALAETLGQMPEYANNIREVYTDRIWNPFMATLMDEAIKKRITTAYNKILEPSFLNQMGSSMSCKSAASLNEDIIRAYRRILELLDVDTSKLERKLKRAQDAEEVLELLYDDALIQKQRS